MPIPINTYEAAWLFDGEDGWLVKDSENEGKFDVNPCAKYACKRLESDANKLAPPLVSREYAIRVVINSPTEWNRRGRISVRLAQKSTPFSEFDLSDAAAGIANWVCFALKKAMRSQGTGSGMIYLVDEPERHLHPLAQEEIARWIMEESRADTCTIIATHATPFLDLRSEDINLKPEDINLRSENVHYVMVMREENGQTVLEPMSEDVLGALEKHSLDLGLSPVAVMQLTRGWLFVEGEDDRQIFETLFNKELGAARIRVLPFRGARRAKATVENLELLRPFGLPLCVVLDNVRAAAIIEGRLPTEAKTEEEKVVEQLIKMRESGLDIEVYPFDYPDIVCALPELVIRALMSEEGLDPAQFKGWDDIVAKWKESGSKPSFKAYALQRLGFQKNQSVTDLIARGLELWDGAVPDRHPLAQTVKGIIAYTDERSRGGSVEASG